MAADYVTGTGSMGTTESLFMLYDDYIAQITYGARLTGLQTFFHNLCKQK